MGIDVNSILNTDPQELQRQRYMQQMQQASKVDPFSQLGFMLGRGISNKMNDRSFFDTTDPALQRVSQTQSIYNTVMKDFDPEDPSKSLTELAKQFSAAGLTQPAMMAATEAAKYGASRRAERRAEYKDNPYLAIDDALKLPEDDPRREALLTNASRMIGKENMDMAIRQAQLKKAEEGRDETARISPLYQTADGKPLTERGGKLFTMDGKPYNDKPITISSNPLANAISQGGAAGTPAAAANNPIQAEIARRRAAERQDRQRAAGTEEFTTEPTGEVTSRIVKAAPLTAEEKATMSLSELQEYNRTGKIPARFLGR